MTNRKSPELRLKEYARAAILKANGENEKAREIFNMRIIEDNDAALERCLCAAYRNSAIHAVLATQFHELRAEGRLPRGANESSPTPK